MPCSVEVLPKCLEKISNATDAASLLISICTDLGFAITIIIVILWDVESRELFFDVVVVNQSNAACISLSRRSSRTARVFAFFSFFIIIVGVVIIVRCRAAG